jgi:hypothetical protein
MLAEKWDLKAFGGNLEAMLRAEISERPAGRRYDA